MSRGWFVLTLYTSEGNAQATEIGIELSHIYGVSISRETTHDSEICNGIMNVSIQPSSEFDNDIRLAEQVMVDIGEIGEMDK